MMFDRVTKGPRARRTLELEVTPSDPQTAVTSREGGEAQVMGVPVSWIRRQAESSSRAVNLLRGNSLVAHGSASPALGAGVTVQVPVAVSEAAWLERLLLNPQALTADLCVLGLTHLNDPLTSGELPASMFAPDSLYNPLIGRFQEVQDPLFVSLRSTAGLAAGAWDLGISAAARQLRKPGGGQPDLRPGISRGKARSLIAIGTTRATVAAGATATFTFPIVEEGVLDRLVIEADGGPWAVTAINYDNDPLLDGGTRVPGALFARNSWASPRFGQYVRAAHILQVVVTNLAGAGGPHGFVAGFTIR